jgi:hypothetical protein
MALLAKETLMYFSYTYAPNLTHQGASVITKKSSVALHTMVEERHQFQTTISPPTIPKSIQKEKTIYLGQKSLCADSPKEARAQCT